MNGNTADDPPRPSPNGGPTFFAPTLWGGGEQPRSVLSPEDRAMLAIIATVVRFRKGERIYDEGAPADAVFNIVIGVVKSCNSGPNGQENVVGFLFPHDIIGLAENGKYINSAKAVTDVTLYRLPTAALEARMQRNPGLDFQIISKLCHDLRAAQQHGFLLHKQRAIAKLALFLEMLETHRNGSNGPSGEIQLPMTRVDIGAYINISPESVSRAFRELVKRGAIRMRSRRAVEIADRAALEAAVSEIDGAA